MKRIVMLIMAMSMTAINFGQVHPGSTCISGDPTNSAGLKTNEMSQVIAGAEHAIGKIEGFYDFTTMGSARSAANTSGSVLLYADWEQSGTIYSENRRFVVDRMNYDIEQGEFVIKDKDNEMFSFDTKKIDKVVINDEVFKTILNNNSGNYELFQVMHDDDGIEILKGFELVFIESSPNPMLNRKANKIKKKEIYYTRNDNQISKIRLSKNKLLKLLEEDNHDLIRKEILMKKNRRIVTRH